MSVIAVDECRSSRQPLLVGGLSRTLFWRRGEAVDTATFLAHVAQVRALLGPRTAALNLCAGRYEFMVAFAAAAAGGGCNLLPSSRAPRVVAELLAAHPHSVAVAGAEDAAAPAGSLRLPPWRHGRADAVPELAAEQCVAIGHTSGSTGQPSAHRKRWGQLQASNARNHAAIAAVVGAASFNIIATVPPQHMYGLEMALVMPLLSPVAVACAIPFYPADVVAALESVPGPRVLVTTPLHLRTLIDSGLPVPPLAAIVSATAPLPLELARRAEAHCGAALIEAFGATETCVIAHRQPVRDDAWTLHADVSVEARPDGTLVRAPWLPQPVCLADIVEQTDPRHFRLCGRQADALEIAGKRASLADLTRRLKAIPGVDDAVVFQREAAGQGARRLAALVVAPDVAAATIMAQLRTQVDPVFLPRPLHKVARLPHNAVGKLPRAALLALLRELEG